MLFIEYVDIFNVCLLLLNTKIQQPLISFSFEQNSSGASGSPDSTEISDPTVPWKNLFDNVERYGSIELIIDLCKEIECIAVLNRYMNINDENELQIFKNLERGKNFL